MTENELTNREHLEVALITATAFIAFTLHNRLYFDLALTCLPFYVPVFRRLLPRQ